MKKVLIVGSNGWLASRIIVLLKEKRKDVMIRGFDITPLRVGSNVDDFIQGDVTKRDDVTKAMKGIDTVFHVASIVNGSAKLLYKVNLEGIRISLSCSIENSVTRFIYTSTASVVFNGVDLVNATEDLPYSSTNLDPYTETKSQAEKLVLSYSGKKGMFTCALRPHSIYGPGDEISWPPILKNAREGKLKWKMTENVHESSYTFVDNIAHAHILAADKLADPHSCARVTGNAYNINDGVNSLFWSKLYDVAELSGVPRREYGKFKIPFFGILYYIAWFFWVCENDNCSGLCEWL
eukprot:TRINITY_DN2202_c0_g1_i3.p1 TRINITY_DN2202_c0_g1~~TRINITY_DN2202_c0_g1_i3.p1  ORF type:complete len:294 (-),score=44.73 TRINITY_DN2202_c0_g1_i3:69-950(-)